MLIMIIFVGLPFLILTIMWVIKRPCPPSVPEPRRPQLELTKLVELTQEAKESLPIGELEEETPPLSLFTSSSLIH